MGTIQFTPTAADAGLIPSLTVRDEVTSRLDVVLKAAPSAGIDPWKADLIGGVLKGIPLDAILMAVERAGPGLGALGKTIIYRQWIAANDSTSPLLHVAWFNLGEASTRAGKPGDAAVAYGNALTLRPDMHVAAINLGLLLEANGQPDQALVTWDRAVQAGTASLALQVQQARLLEKLGRLGEAEKVLHRVLLRDPAQPDIIFHWVHLRQETCQWPVAPSDVPGVTAAELLASAGPLGILALTDDIEMQTEAAAAWVARHTQPTLRHLAPLMPYSHRRIRIGYLSSDFGSHAVSYLIAELLERHDRCRFEVFGYCSSQDDGTELRQRILAAFDHCRFISGISDAAAAQVIRNDEIDILIDLNGITDGNRLQVLRWKPAPIQATYLGFVGSVPIPELDYLLCDRLVIPAEYEAAYQPKPLPIGRFYQANDSKRGHGRPMSRAEAGLPANGFVFCCFAKHYKITEAIFGAWMTILKRADRAILWLAKDNPYSEANLLEEARGTGIAGSRLIFSERVDREPYLRRLGAADLFLDTFPYNAGTVASDAIRMNLPLVTISGKAFAARMAGRLLHAIDAGKGICTSLDHYIDMAVQLATDQAAYERYQALFTDPAWDRTIGDIATFTKDYEETWIELIDRSARHPRAGQSGVDGAIFPRRCIQAGA